VFVQLAVKALFNLLIHPENRGRLVEAGVVKTLATIIRVNAASWAYNSPSQGTTAQMKKRVEQASSTHRHCVMGLCVLTEFDEQLEHDDEARLEIIRCKAVEAVFDERLILSDNEVGEEMQYLSSIVLYNLSWDRQTTTGALEVIGPDLNTLRALLLDGEQEDADIVRNVMYSIYNFSCLQQNLAKLVPARDHKKGVLGCLRMIAKREQLERKLSSGTVDQLNVQVRSRLQLCGNHIDVVYGCNSYPLQLLAGVMYNLTCEKTLHAKLVQGGFVELAGIVFEMLVRDTEVAAVKKTTMHGGESTYSQRFVQKAPSGEQNATKSGAGISVSSARGASKGASGVVSVWGANKSSSIIAAFTAAQHMKEHIMLSTERNDPTELLCLALANLGCGQVGTLRAFVWQNGMYIHYHFFDLLPQVSTRRMVDDGAIEMLNVFVLTPYWSSHPERLRVSAAYRNLIVPCGNQETVMQQGGLKALVHLATRTRAPRMAHLKRGSSDYNSRGKTHRIGVVKRDPSLLNLGGPTSLQTPSDRELSTDDYQQVLDQIGDNCASALLAISGNSKLKHLIIGNKEVAGILALKSGFSGDKFGKSTRQETAQDFDLAVEREHRQAAERHRDSIVARGLSEKLDAEMAKAKAAGNKAKRRAREAEERRRKQEEEREKLFSPSAVFSSELLAEIEQETWFNGSTGGRGVGRAPPPEDEPKGALAPPTVMTGLQMSEENAPHLIAKMVSVPWAVLESLHTMPSLPFPGTRTHPVHTSPEVIHTTSLDLDSLEKVDIGGLPMPSSLAQKQVLETQETQDLETIEAAAAAAATFGDQPAIGTMHSTMHVRTPSNGPQRESLVGNIRRSKTVNLRDGKSTSSNAASTGAKYAIRRTTQAQNAKTKAVITKSSQLCFPINPTAHALEQLPSNETNSTLAESGMWMLFPKLTIGKEWEHKQLPESQRRALYKQEQELMFERRMEADTAEQDQEVAVGAGGAGGGTAAAAGASSGSSSGISSEPTDGGSSGGMERERLARCDALGRSKMVRRMRKQKGGMKGIKQSHKDGEEKDDETCDTSEANKAMVNQMTKQLKASCGWLQQRKKEARKRKEAQRLQNLENERVKQMQRNVDRRSLMLDEEMVDRLANHASAMGVIDSVDGARASMPRSTAGRVPLGSPHKNGHGAGQVGGAAGSGGGVEGTYTDESNSRTSSRISSGGRSSSHRSPNSSRTSSRTTSRETKGKGWGKEWTGGGDSSIVDGVGGVLDQSSITNISSYSSLASSAQTSRTDLGDSMGASEGVMQSPADQVKRRTFNSSSGGTGSFSKQTHNRRPSRISSRRFVPAKAHRGSVAERASKQHSRGDHAAGGSGGSGHMKSRGFPKGQSSLARTPSSGPSNSRLIIPAYRKSSSSGRAGAASGNLGPGTTVRALATGSRYASTG
jgi:hypothetical protein